RVFGDYLLSLGVTSRAVESKEGWAIWVHNEDQVPKAREEFEAYQKDPDDPRFGDAPRAARAVRAEEELRNRQYRTNVRDTSGRYDGLNAGRRPLTVALMAACIGLHLASVSSDSARIRLYDTFGFFSIKTLILAQHGALAEAGLADIHRGEVWRLVTPIFLHVNWMHLIFNMSALWYEGTLIEYCRGTRTLAVLTLVSAVVSNIGQYLYEINFSTRGLTLWFGISGVAYALFGYIWMKSRYEPEHGIRISPQAVRPMMLWLLLGFTGILPMANGAHV